jgi:hypothetical protein
MKSISILLLLAACGDSLHVADDPRPDASPSSDAPTVMPDGTTTIEPSVHMADMVVAAPGATGTGAGDPMRAINGVRGGGFGNGSLDVFSLGYVDGVNNFITLGWSNGLLQNGPGADVAVFENPFRINGGTFMDLIIVEASLDGIEFRELAHDYTAADPTVYQASEQLWSGFAGRTPVILNVDTNPMDPFDPEAGGDAFDLDTVVGTDAVAQEIRAKGAKYIRLVTAPSRIDPHTGALYVHDAIANGADIDGVYGRYVATSRSSIAPPR